MTQHTAQRLLGDGTWTAKHAAVARWVTHTDLAALADAANGRKGTASLIDTLAPVDHRLADVAQDFVDLQAARHGADYDDFFPISKAAALSYVDAARRAIKSADALYDESEPSYMRFLGLAVGGVKGLFKVRGETGVGVRLTERARGPDGMGVAETSTSQRTTSRVRAYGLAA
jgi:hypothetical protein